MSYNNATMKQGSNRTVDGFSLVETLLVLALLTVGLLTITQTLLAVTRSFASFRAAGRISQDGSGALGRMVREARGAQSIDSSSVLNAHPGKLVLTAVTASGTPRVAEFYLDSGRLMLKEDGVVIGALTGTKTTLENLIFRSVDTGRSTGVKIEFTLSSGAGGGARSENFYASTVLRDSY